MGLLSPCCKHFCNNRKTICKSIRYRIQKTNKPPEGGLQETPGRQLNRQLPLAGHFGDPEYGSDLCSITDSSTTTLLTFSSEGRSYMVSSNTDSTMVRRPCTGLALDCFLAIAAPARRDGFPAPRPPCRKQFLELLGDGIFGLGQNLDQHRFVQLLQRCATTDEAADKFRNQAILDQVFRFHLRQHLADICLAFGTLDLGAKPNPPDSLERC